MLKTVEFLINNMENKINNLIIFIYIIVNSFIKIFIIFNIKNINKIKIINNNIINFIIKLN